MGGIEAAGAAGLTALLFYRSIAVSPILLLPVGGMFLYVWEKEILRKKEREFTRQFLDTLQSVSAALNVGYSLENAMLEAEKEMRIMYREQDRIVREWKYMIRQMKMNLSMERILEEFSWRVDQEDVRNFVTVIAAVKKSGGNMAKVIRKTMFQIQEKEEPLEAGAVRITGGSGRMDLNAKGYCGEEDGVSCNGGDPIWYDCLYVGKFSRVYGGALSGDSGQSGDDRMSPFVFGSFLEWVSNDKD